MVPVIVTTGRSGADGRRALEIARAHSLEEIDRLGAGRDAANRGAWRNCLLFALASMVIAVGIQWIAIEQHWSPAWMMLLLAPAFACVRMLGIAQRIIDDHDTFSLAKVIKKELLNEKKVSDPG
mgnify:CR=1 FL=1